MNNTDKRTAILSRLKGFLESVNTIKTSFLSIENGENAIWEDFNDAVESLSAVSDGSYEKFKISPISRVYGTGISTSVLASKAGGLIGQLYGELFPEEVCVHVSESSPATTVVTATAHQAQEQTTNIEIENTIHRLEKKLQQHDEGTPEKNFLKRAIETIKSIKDIKELFPLVLNIATQAGLTPEKALALLS